MSAWFLAGGVRFKDILPAEQFEFALRLWRSAPLWVLPGLFILIDEWIRNATIKMCLVFGCLAPIGWFLVYPQHNHIVQNVAPSIGEVDIQTVRHIHDLTNASTSTTVFIAPQMVSAAYIREYGFGEQIDTVYGQRNLYALPTGGELYGLYLQLFTSGQTRDVVQTIRNAVHDKPLIVVVPRAWDPENRIDTALSDIRIQMTEEEYRLYLVR